MRSVAYCSGAAISNELTPSERKVQRSVFGYSLAISACQKLSKWPQAIDLLDFMLLQAVSPDVYSFTSTVTSCAADGQWQLAAALLHDMQELQVLPNQVTYASFVGSFGKEGKWQRVLDVLYQIQSRRDLLDSFSCAAAVSACTRATKWHLGLRCFQTLQRQGLTLSEVGFNTAISACSKGSLWQEAMDLLHDMRVCRLAPDLITYNAIIASLAAGGQWRKTTHLFGRLPALSFTPNVISFTSTMVALKACEGWQDAVMLHGSIRHALLQQNDISFGACISSCEKSGQWSEAVKFLSEMPVARLRPDMTSTNAAISACEASGNWDLGISSLIASELMGQTRSASSFMWALARLHIRDPVVVHAAMVEAICDMRKHLFQDTRQMSTMWWAGQMLGASSNVYTDLMTERTVARLPDFTSKELVMSLWGAAGTGNVFVRSAQQEWVHRIQTMLSSSRFPMDDWQQMRSHILGSLWACTYAGMASEAFRLAVKNVMLVAGQALDETVFTKASTLLSRCLARGQTIQHRIQQEKPCMPYVLSEIPDLLVILKPPGWEVEARWEGGEMNYRSLHSLLTEESQESQIPLGSSAPIFFDAGATFGFLHRLDVPSSGLVLASRTYQAYYALSVQLAAGEILRGYNVLTHGWVNHQRKEINARVYWRGGLPSRSSGQGKPSRSFLKVILHGYVGVDVTSVTVTAVSIATGRRHQIRCHLAHIGHPVCKDDAYASQESGSSDWLWCPRNALHRYRIRFRDMQGLEHDVVSPLPVDLAEVLQKVTSKTGSQSSVCTPPPAMGMGS
ncbi:unnamed protein product [Symbiodinium natans]|uniref:Pseudouridine synthase RsuA/RluA-like domain-containing protein n=1 Tax=Symbiodinium natans TaxID=878477 RepID=A0A812J4L2_9DINO|nr:unnamed protein product [Symbiodinium natans]